MARLAHPPTAPVAYVLVRSEDLQIGPDLMAYIAQVDATLIEHGVEILVHNLPVRVLEGSWPGFVTLLRFPDIAAAERWYVSPEYASIKKLRQSSSTPTAVLVAGVAPDHRSADLIALALTAADRTLCSGDGN